MTRYQPPPDPFATADTLAPEDAWEPVIERGAAYAEGSREFYRQQARDAAHSIAEFRDGELACLCGAVVPVVGSSREAQRRAFWAHTDNARRKP